MNTCSTTSCVECQQAHLERLGIKMDRWDYVVALAGNPNTGKSTVFNQLTGLHQHTGNWPGKTIARAEGGFAYNDKKFKLVDLPGTYSLLSASADEEVARDFILFGRPDVTVVVVDATRLERNLNLVLQILQITNKAIVCLNLIDEAKAHGLQIDARGLGRDLGVPVVPTIARKNQGMDLLLQEIHDMAQGKSATRPVQLPYEGLQNSVEQIAGLLKARFPNLPQTPWIALRLLQGDQHIIRALRSGELGKLGEDHHATLLQKS